MEDGGDAMSMSFGEVFSDGCILAVADGVVGCPNGFDAFVWFWLDDMVDWPNNVEFWDG